MNALTVAAGENSPALAVDSDGEQRQTTKAACPTTRDIAHLISCNARARTHSEAQVAQIAASIKEFGFTNPVLIDEHDTIIAGEGRMLAAKKLKLQAVPCVVLVGLSDAQKAAYAIADNKLALNAGWDEATLQSELVRLAELDYNLNLTGFSEVEVAALLDAISADMDDVGFELPGPPPDGGLPEGRQPEATHPYAGHADARTAWQGMPEFSQPEAGPFRTVKVHFMDQAAVDAFAKLIGRKLSNKAKWLWFPAKTTDTTEVVYG